MTSPFFLKLNTPNVEDNKQFFEREEAINRDKWMCADAWRESFDNEWGNADGSYTGSNDSQSYVIQIVNSCATAAISNVDFGQSAKERFNTPLIGVNYGNSPYITLSSAVPDVSYDEFLSMSESEPFTVGSTMVISTSAGQLEQGMQVTQKDAGGEINSIVLNQTLSPMQTLTDRVISFKKYYWNAATRFRFNSINAGATVTVRLNIYNKFSALDLMSGKSGVLSFGNSNLIGIR